MFPAIILAILLAVLIIADAASQANVRQRSR